MGNKMSRWEKQYEQYINGEKKQKLVKLKNKLENKSITREEYEEYKNMQKIEKNLPKVKNLQELHKQLIEAKSEIIAELNRRERSEKANKDFEKENQKLENELEKINKQKEKILSELKNKDLSEQKTAVLKDKLIECENKIQANNKKYLENNERQPKEIKDQDISKISKKELIDKAIKLSIKIDICNLYATRLMKGKDIEQIKSEENNINLNENEYRKNIKDEVKTYTLPTEQKEKMEVLKDASKKIDEKVEILDSKKKIEIEKNEETNVSMIEVSEFDQKHPKLAVIKNWFKKGFEKFIKKDEMSEKDIKHEIKVEPKKEKADKRRDAFLKSIKFIEDVDISEIAEKGLDEVRKEDKNKRQIEAAKKLLENKKNARGDVDIKSIQRLEAKIKDAGEDR